jgi:hypothetical protein
MTIIGEIFLEQAPRSASVFYLTMLFLQLVAALGPIVQAFTPGKRFKTLNHE